MIHVIQSLKHLSQLHRERLQVTPLLYSTPHPIHQKQIRVNGTLESHSLWHRRMKGERQRMSPVLIVSSLLSSSSVEHLWHSLVLHSVLLIHHSHYLSSLSLQDPSLSLPLQSIHPWKAAQHAHSVTHSSQLHLEPLSR